MKQILGGLLLAALLAAAGTLALAEARHADRVAEAQRRLTTLRADRDDLEATATPVSALPPPVGLGANATLRHSVTQSYWRARYSAVASMLAATTTPSNADPVVLLLAANAAFRTSAPASSDKKAALSRLDAVMQAYGDALRKDPSLVDASFNYELVGRIRDQVAKAPQQRGLAHSDQSDPSTALIDRGDDLPSGTTIHGAQGGPPANTSMSDFKTVTPMRYDEREEQMDPGQGQKLQRKG